MSIPALFFLWVAVVSLLGVSAVSSLASHQKLSDVDNHYLPSEWEGWAQVAPVLV